ncbi:MAG: HAD-IA family hydrolase [Candidatus Aenigmatarchaeota archaeon]
MGKISEDDFWTIFLEKAGASKIYIEQAKKIWRKYQNPMENMPDLLVKLKKNYQLVALTTISKEWLDYKKKKFSLDSYFETIVSSGYSGLSKPDPRIFKLILKKIDKKSEECLFIDNDQRHIASAKTLGIKTILFTGQSALEKQLKKLGIKF